MRKAFITIGDRTSHGGTLIASQATSTHAEGRIST